MSHSVDYSHIAATYDRRYSDYKYAGVERTLFSFVGTHHDYRVLEVGCGTGHWLELLAGRGFSPFGLDPSGRMLQRAKAQVQDATLMQGQAEQIPWKDASLDRLICVNAFHHFDGKGEFISEANRVLRAGGGLITIGLDPHTNRDQWYIYEYFKGTLETNYERYPPTHQILKFLRSAGFSRCHTTEAQHISLQLPGREAIEKGQLSKTSTSQLTILTDKEYKQGITRIWKDIETAEDRGEQLSLVADLRLYATIGWVE